MKDLFINNRDDFNIKYLDKSKEPFQLVSIFYALDKAYNNDNVIINNPILFDATCSGIQHLSALTREMDMAIKTNLIGSGNNMEIPNDFYNYASDLIQKELDQSNNEKLANIKMNRSLIKKSVMTIPYNISLIGVKEQLYEFFTKSKFLGHNYYNLSENYSKNNKIISLSFNEFNLLTVIIFKVLTEKLPSLKVLSNYLNSLVKLLLKLNQPIF